MKIPVPVHCLKCGCDFQTSGYGETTIPPARCPRCDQTIYVLDPLTISVLADRLLLRSQIEIEESDFTVSIICSAIAVECALTQVFVKWKALEHLRSIGQEPAEIDQEALQNEYRKKTKGGFQASADFVSAFLVGRKYDEFVNDLIETSKTAPAEWIKRGLPRWESQTQSRYINEKLFAKRNRILHWGEATYNNNDAHEALVAAAAAIAVLKQMDARKLKAMEEQERLVKAVSAPQK